MAKVSKQYGPRKADKGKGGGRSPTLNAPASNPGVHPRRPKRGGCGGGDGPLPPSMAPAVPPKPSPPLPPKMAPAVPPKPSPPLPPKMGPAVPPKPSPPLPPKMGPAVPPKPKPPAAVSKAAERQRQRRRR